MGAGVVHADDVEARHGVFRALSDPLGVKGFRVNRLELPAGKEGRARSQRRGPGRGVRNHRRRRPAARGRRGGRVASRPFRLLPPQARRQMVAGDTGLVWIGIGSAPGANLLDRERRRAESRAGWFRPAASPCGFSARSLGSSSPATTRAAGLRCGRVCFRAALPPPLHSHPQDETFTCSTATSPPGSSISILPPTRAILPRGCTHARSAAVPASFFRTWWDAAHVPCRVGHRAAAFPQYPRRCRGIRARAERTGAVAVVATAGRRACVPAERMQAVERELEMIRHGPPPPRLSVPDPGIEPVHAV